VVVGVVSEISDSGDAELGEDSTIRVSVGEGVDSPIVDSVVGVSVGGVVVGSEKVTVSEIIIGDSVGDAMVDVGSAGGGNVDVSSAGGGKVDVGFAGGGKVDVGSVKVAASEVTMGLFVEVGSIWISNLVVSSTTFVVEIGVVVGVNVLWIVTRAVVATIGFSVITVA
jgi:hypothetical protein